MRIDAELSHLQVVIALLRDGFHPTAPGHCDDRRRWRAGARLSADALRLGWRAGVLTMAEIQFRGCDHGNANYRDGTVYGNRPTRARQSTRSRSPLATPVVSAHVMGGRAGPEPKHAAIDVDGRYHHLANLYVLDGRCRHRSARIRSFRIYGPSRGSPTAWRPGSHPRAHETSASMALKASAAAAAASAGVHSMRATARHGGD
jgi:hypothetical protein